MDRRKTMKKVAKVAKEAKKTKTIKSLKKQKSTAFSKETKTHFVEIFLGMLNTVKLYHWKTYSYATHEATDKLYAQLNEHIDEFVEVMLGKDESRLPMFDIDIPLTNTSSVDVFKKRVYKYREFLIDMDTVLDARRDGDLLHLRDGILADINQFLYLLTFFM